MALSSIYSSYRVTVSTARCLAVLLLASSLSSPVSAQSSLPLPTPDSEGPELLEGTLSSEAYILGAGDQVEVNVFRLPEYSGTYEVLVDGTLRLPMIGQVSVAGMTLEEAQAAISQG